MHRLTALEIAQKAAKEYPTSYTSSGEEFAPHRWVIAAIIEAGSRSNMFRQVKLMNEAFGNPEGDPNHIDALRLMSQCKNVGSEFKELMREFGIDVHITYAVRPEGATGNIDNIRDALCDIMVFALGGYHFMGYDADRDMQEVIEAVMTRFCKDKDQLDATTMHYINKGVSFDVEGEFPRKYLKSNKDQGNGEYPKGKFLKSVGYRAPTFYQVPKPVDAVAEMARQREALAKELAEKKRIRDEKILKYTNELLLADGESISGADE